MTTYFGFAMSDSMFSGDLMVSRKSVSLAQAKEIIEQGVTPCLNPSHGATVSAMRQMGISVEIPASPPRVNMTRGDSLLVLQVGGLPRLTDRHEYTLEEVAKATFSFSLWTVQP